MYRLRSKLAVCLFKPMRLSEPDDTCSQCNLSNFHNLQFVIFIVQIPQNCFGVNMLTPFGKLDCLIIVNYVPQCIEMV